MLRRSLIPALLLLALASPAQARPLPADPPTPPSAAKAHHGFPWEAPAALLGVAALGAVAFRRRRVAA